MKTWEEMVDFIHDYKPVYSIECYRANKLCETIFLGDIWDLEQSRDYLFDLLIGELCGVIDYLKVNY